MKERIVYLVKFDCGYFAEKQPSIDSSFTKDKYAARRYETHEEAKELGEWELVWALGPQPALSYTIEEHKIKTVMERVIPRSKCKAKLENNGTCPHHNLQCA